MRLYTALYGLVFQFFLDSAYCQTNPKIGAILEKKVSLGLSYQTFAFERWSSPEAGSIFNSILFGSQNAEGFGLTLPVSIYAPNRKFGILINPVIRYDIVYQEIIGIGTQKRKEKSKIFSDFHVTLFKKMKIGNSKLLFDIGLGYSFISPFLSFKEDYIIIVSQPYKPKYYEGNKVRLDFQGFNAYLKIPLSNKLSIQQRLIYVPKGQIIYKSYWTSYFFQIGLLYDLTHIKSK
jgi:hypothetical protein